jgi:hypothetical protein
MARGTTQFLTETVPEISPGVGGGEDDRYVGQRYHIASISCNTQGLSRPVKVLRSLKYLHQTKILYLNCKTRSTI